MLCLCHGALSPASHSCASHSATQLRSSHCRARTIQSCQEEKAKATFICSPTSSLGPAFLSSDTQFFFSFNTFFKVPRLLLKETYWRVLSFKDTAGERHHTQRSTILQEEFALSEVCWDVRGKMGAERLNLVRMEVLENIQSRSSATWESWILKT